jgi:DNA-binding MurR/RpiR family transcriptional regulator
LYHCAKNARNKLIWAGQQSFSTKDYVEDALSDFKKNLEMFLPVVTTEITEKAIEKFANANNRGSAGSGQAVAKCIEMMNEFQRLVLQVHVELQMSGGENKIAVKSKIKSIL